MNHVHWQLAALSFLVGLVFTYALIARPTKRQGPVRVPQRGRQTRAQRTAAPQEVSATRIAGGRLASTTRIPIAKKPSRKKPPTAEEPPTTKIPVTEKTTKIPVTEKTTKIPVTEKTAKIPVTEKTAKIPVDATRKIGAPHAPYGRGSAHAGADGSGPSGWTVKGRSDTRQYYVPGDSPYDEIKAQVWFRDEESAARALFTAWRKGSTR